MGLKQIQADYRLDGFNYYTDMSRLSTRSNIEGYHFYGCCGRRLLVCVVLRVAWVTVPVFYAINAA